MNQFRVVYRNQLDQSMRVLIGGLDKETAQSVLLKFANPKAKNFYMGRETRLETDPGNAEDGAVISEVAA